jgi:hypothetical protein
VQSSRDVFFNALTSGVVQQAALSAAAAYRSQLTGVDPPEGSDGSPVICGFLLRSALVSGWPGLAVRPRATVNGTSSLLRLLRLDRLSPTVLLGLVWGVPDTIEFAEPQEAFRLGLDPDNPGTITLRDPSDPSTQIASSTITVVDATGAGLMRAAGSRVLDLGDAAGPGLVAAIQQQLPTGDTLGPGGLAVQLLRTPETFVFQRQDLSV